MSNTSTSNDLRASSTAGYEQKGSSTAVISSLVWPMKKNYLVFIAPCKYIYTYVKALSFCFRKLKPLWNASADVVKIFWLSKRKRPLHKRRLHRSRSRQTPHSLNLSQDMI